MNATRPIEIFTKGELARLTSRSDLMGFWGVLSTWVVIAGAFAMVARWPHVWTAVLAVVVLGGRQLALAILMHEGAHRTLFRTRWWNDAFVDWTCARPVWADLEKYRTHHLVHHREAGTDDDIDISLIAPFPTTPRSLARKLLRDAVGVTGLKIVFGRLLMDAGVFEWTVASDVRRIPRRGRRVHDYVLTAIVAMTPAVVTNAVLFGVLAATGHPRLYALWVVSYMTTLPLFIRIRSMAEHACTEMTRDSLRNTRTTRAGWLARATVAPIRVNYHIEHHLVVGVPYFRLPAMHRLLRERGVTPKPPGYWGVLRIVSGRSAAA
jgi:fatty acid desaturase